MSRGPLLRDASADGLAGSLHSCLFLCPCPPGLSAHGPGSAAAGVARAPAHPAPPEVRWMPPLGTWLLPSPAAPSLPQGASTSQLPLLLHCFPLADVGVHLCSPQFTPASAPWRPGMAPASSQALKLGPLHSHVHWGRALAPASWASTRGAHHQLTPTLIKSCPAGPRLPRL